MANFFACDLTGANLSGANLHGCIFEEAVIKKANLPELASYTWVDIMKIAAYKQYNRAITDDMDCCLSGRLKRGYGVEQILGMLKPRYWETHNAYFHALDELEIVELLGLGIEVYENAILN